MVVVLIESDDALFRNNQFFADALFTDFHCTMVKDNENAFHLSSVSIEKISQFMLSQIQNHQSQFVGQTLDTHIHLSPRSPHMKQSPVHSCGVPPKISQIIENFLSYYT